MARKKEATEQYAGHATPADAFLEQPIAPLRESDSNGATATLDAPPILPAAQPVPNGEQPVPQPAATPKRKKAPRDPDAPRPLYFTIAIRRDNGACRIIGSEPTIGRARKALPNTVYGIRDNEDGPFIVRAKMVS